MVRYSHERKEAVLSKLLPSYNLTIAELTRQEGISEATLYNWRKQAKSEQWSAEAKLATVIETTTLSEAQLSVYCREKGLYPDHVKRWKAEPLQGFQRSAKQEQSLRKQARSDRQEIQKLQRELRSKEKALAEVATLLVLRKKLNALWDNNDSNEDE